MNSTSTFSSFIGGLPFYPAPQATLYDFLNLSIVTYIGILIVYFVTGGFFHWLNLRHPERRIQTRPFRSLVAVEIKTSIFALATIALLLAGGIFAQAKGWTMAPLEPSWWSVSLTFFISLVIYDTWFYWGHRLLHTKALYYYHAHHHKSVVPTPWANNSDTQVGDIIEQSYFLVAPFILPINPYVLLIHKLYDQVTGIAGHAGHEYFAHAITRYPSPMICTTFHDQHHGYFDYNFANTFSWWDRWMGTLHPSYDSVVVKFENFNEDTAKAQLEAQAEALALSKSPSRVSKPKAS